MNVDARTGAERCSACGASAAATNKAGASEVIDVSARPEACAGAKPLELSLVGKTEIVAETKSSFTKAGSMSETSIRVEVRADTEIRDLALQNVYISVAPSAIVRVAVVGVTEVPKSTVAADVVDIARLDVATLALQDIDVFTISAIIVTSVWISIWVSVVAIGVEPAAAAKVVKVG